MISVDKWFDVLIHYTFYKTHRRWKYIGRPQGPWSLLNLRPLHRIVIFAIENHFSLAKWPPLLSVASSASDKTDVMSIMHTLNPIIHNITILLLQDITDTCQM